MMRRMLLLKDQNRFAVLIFKKLEELELVERCLDVLVRKSDFLQVRKKYESKHRKQPRVLADNEEDFV